MGGLLHKLSLTKPGLEYDNGQRTFYDSPESRNVAQIIHTQPQPQMADLSGQQLSPIAAGPPDASGSLPLANDTSAPVPFNSSAPAVVPKAIKPDFQKESIDEAGNTKAPTRGMTKLGVLTQFLRIAAQGASDAAANGALDAVPGRSNVGAGIEGATVMPFVRSQRKLATEREQLGNETARANLSLLPLQRAAQFAQVQSGIDYHNAQAKYWASEAARKDQDNLQQLHAAAVQEAINAGRDPQQDPKVQQYADAITSLQKQAATKAASPFTEWREKNPNAPIKAWFDLQNQSRDDFRPDREPGARNADGTRKPTRGQFQQATVRKNNNLRGLENQYKFVPASGMYEDKKTGETIGADEFTQKKQSIQDQYEEEIAGLTGDEPNHVAFNVKDAESKAPPAAAPGQASVTGGSQTAAGAPPVSAFTKGEGVVHIFRNPKTKATERWILQGGVPTRVP